jgi:sugar phosphate isomerase/epimerase
VSSQSPHNITLSSVWASSRTEDGVELLDRLAETGIASLELEYRVTTPMLTQLRRELGPRGLTVASVHNFFPLPPEMPRERASGDLFNLAASDKEERLLAVRQTQHTLEQAAELEAGVVVLHLGWLEGLEDKKVTREAALAGGQTPEIRQHLERRRVLAPAGLDAVSFALDRVVARALRLGLKLGLENRFHAYQVPNLDEAEFLLERFAGAPVGYWHDTGHAHNRELAGLNPASAWLERLGGRLIGCHLHDAVGPADHQLPGRGDMDWPALARLMLPARPKVLELRPGPSAAEIAQAAAWLEGLFAEAAAEAQDADKARQAYTEK